MIHKVIFTIFLIISIGIILNNKCDCNEDKERPFDVIQLLIIYIIGIVWLDIKSIILFCLTILVSFAIKECLKQLFLYRKKKIKITKNDCDCKNSYKRFL